MVLYCPEWAERFELHRKTITEAMGPVATRIEHIGSTSVRPQCDEDHARGLYLRRPAVPEADRCWPGTRGRLCVDGSPYPGAKPHILVEGDRWEDAEWLTRIIEVSAKELPEPAKKKRKR